MKKETKKISVEESVEEQIKKLKNEVSILDSTIKINKQEKEVKEKAINQLEHQQKQERVRTKIDLINKNVEFRKMLLNLIECKCKTYDYRSRIYFEYGNNVDEPKYICPHCALKEILDGEWGTELDFDFELILK